MHDKRVKLANKLEDNLREDEKPFFHLIKSKIEAYKTSLEELRSKSQQFEHFYSQTIFNQRLHLQQIGNEPVLKNGLLLSSHSFLQQLEKYIAFPIEKFAKKR